MSKISKFFLGTHSLICYAISTNMTFTKGVGSPAYMAPEVLNRQKYKKAADVFSFAIIMLEVVVWSDAYPKKLFPFPWRIADKVANGERTESIENVDDEKMKQLIIDCWKHEPLERLTMDGIVQRLYKLWESSD